MYIIEPKITEKNTNLFSVFEKDGKKLQLYSFLLCSAVLGLPPTLIMWSMSS